MQVIVEGDNFTVKLKGPFDRQTAPGIRKKLLKFIRKRSTKSVTVNLSGVPSMDTAGVAVLVEVLRSLSQRGRKLRLEGLNERALSMVHLARLDQVFEIT